MNGQSKIFLECLDACGCVHVKDEKNLMHSNDSNDKISEHEKFNRNGSTLNGVSNTPFADAVQSLMNEEGLQIFQNSVDSFNKGSCHMKLLIDKLIKGECMPRHNTTTQINHDNESKKYESLKSVVKKMEIARNHDHMNVIDLEDEVIINSNQIYNKAKSKRFSLKKTNSHNSHIRWKNTGNSSTISRLDSANLTHNNNLMIEKSEIKYKTSLKQKLKEDHAHVESISSTHKKTKIPPMPITKKVQINNIQDKKENPLKIKKAVSLIPKDSIHISEVNNRLSKAQTCQEIKTPMKSQQTLRTSSFVSIRQFSNVLEEMPSNVSSEFYSAFSSIDRSNFKSMDDLIKTNQH